MDLKNMTAKEVHDCIMKHSKSISDDEWLEISDWIDKFLKSNPPPEEKKMFVPLGCAEIVCIVCDGIKRRRKAICNKCSKLEAGHICEIYPERIPKEIWVHEDAQCPYFEEES